MKNLFKHQQNPFDPGDNDHFEKTAVRVSMVSIIGNLILSVFKLFIGIAANSGAMVSDAVHSASDMISSFIVIIGVKISAKESDKDHPYGHERIECVASIILAVTLLLSGIFIGHAAVTSIFSSDHEVLPVPKVSALIAAIISITVKEAMYWYTRHYAIRLNSGALMADAWHHRSDSLSSIGALIGIAGARMGISLFDPIASLIICLFIIKASYDIFMDAVSKLVDKSCSEEMQQQIIDFCMNQTYIDNIGKIQTRMFGNRIYVDIEVLADGSISLYKSHEISVRLHDDIEANFPEIKHIAVFVLPLGSDE